MERERKWGKREGEEQLLLTGNLWGPTAGLGWLWAGGIKGTAMREREKERARERGVDGGGGEKWKWGAVGKERVVIVEREETIRHLHAKGCYTDLHLKFWGSPHIFTQLGTDQGAQGNIKYMRIICQTQQIKMNKTYAIWQHLAQCNSITGFFHIAGILHQNKYCNCMSTSTTGKHSTGIYHLNKYRRTDINTDIYTNTCTHRLNHNQRQSLIFQNTSSSQEQNPNPHMRTYTLWYTHTSFANKISILAWTDRPDKPISGNEMVMPPEKKWG